MTSATEHVHEWYLIEDSADCNECQYMATIAVAKCKWTDGNGTYCYAQIGPTEIERRLNAGGQDE